VQVGKKILVRRSTFDHWLEYVLPDSAVWLVPELKQNREDLIGLLKNVGTPPQMPPGVRLLKWEPQTPPVVIVRMEIVNNSTSSFVPLFELRARLESKHFLAGNWSLRELVERLEQVGAQVEIERERSMAEPVMHE
jgi:hypothetical protein